MTDTKPEPGDPTQSTDNASAPPEPEEAETAAEQPDDAGVEASADEQVAVGAADEPTEPVEGSDAGTAEDTAVADESAPGTVAETEAEAADAAAAGAAWTTTPVAPDPEATEAALAALAAKPEVTIEPPEAPPVPPPGVGGEPPDEGTPVLLVGGILVGAFIVALAIVLILFRPFDSTSEVDASLSPSPIVTEIPSASPSAIASVDTPNFQGESLEDAEALAADYGLVVRVNPVETDDFEPDTVLDQEPAPGEAVEAGSTIDLSVARAVPTTPVPDLGGLTENGAVNALEDAGFKVGDITEDYSDEFRAGFVISTDPEADSELPAGSTVDLVVSLGPETVAVPDLVDLTEFDALAALDDAGLVAGDKTESNDETIVAGNVISTDPAADTEVSPGAAVAYVLSLGPETVAVPDLVDLTEFDALAALDDAGLVAGDKTESNDETIVAGNVISTDPAADAEVSPGAAVAYVLSLGPETVAVPDLVDLTEFDALAALDDAGLVAGDKTESNDETIVAGNVISTDPAADAEVSPGAAVAYVLSLGPETVAVPDLVDLTEFDALAALDDAGLVAGDKTESNDETIVAGNVISTDPAADAEVSPGAAVAYVLSLGPETVAVPDLVDLTEFDALAALDDAGLVAGDKTESNDETIVAGNVISTDPAADAEVSPGAAVAYVLSLGPETVAVPDLVDLTEFDALAALDDAGLVAGDKTESNDETIVAGNVISTDPAADAEVRPGAAVAYVLSLGPETVAVPDLVDLTEFDALAALDDAGLVAGDKTESNDETIVAGNVISTDPAADAEVSPGAAVAYVLSLGPETVAVPDLVDLTEFDALAALDDAGLVAGDKTESNDETIVAGNVISTDPAADAEVSPGAAVAYVLSLGPETVAVPDLVDLTEFDALAALDDAGLVAGDKTESNDETIVAGNVISTDPAADTEVRPGSAVSYVTSRGVETVAVPDLSGPADAAEQTLADARLVAGDVSEAFSDEVAAGEVISQDPAADTEVRPGSAVSYVTSRGVETVAVPDLSGPADAAEQTLADARLVAGDVSEAFSDEVAAGEVISQDPAADTEVRPGSAVSYVTSRGVETVAVPDLSGPADAAEQTLADARLVAGDVSEAFSDEVAAGEVISQDPAADTEVRPGSAVSYVTSRGVETVAVPDLSGPADAAEQTLADARLVAGDVSEAFSDEVAAGEVISQDPAADTEVRPGSAVSYVTSRGVETVAVPDLSGPADAAEQTLADARLVAGDVSEAFSDEVAAGEVISQDPAADTEVRPGSAVSYVTSRGVETVAVPDLSGPADAAEQTLADARLVAGDVSEAFSDEVAAGEVISQDPAADTEVRPGSAVSYVTSRGVETVAVPDLSGPADAAEQTLADARLVAGDVSEAFSDEVAAGEVISQDPAADTEVRPGSAVSYVTSRGVETVAVPDLSGPADAAEQTLADARLVAGDVSEAFSDEVAAGEVISQDPAADTEVRPGSAVSYVTSRGVETVAVPDLSGPADAAEQTLADARLVAGDVSEAFSDEVAAGEVISQDPAADTEVRPGSAVSYVTSRGVETVAVPDLSGPADAAEQTLADARLVAGDVSEAFSDEVAAGEVISQDPAADTEVRPGSAVSYVTSRGVETVAVPDLSGPADAAEQTLADARLVAGDVSEAFSDEVAAGEVISQDPAADTEVRPGSAVSYVTSRGVETVAVPDLSGPADAAEQTLADARLVAGDVSEAFSDEVAAGEVISQDPAADTEVRPGSAVSYVTSRGVETVAVPDLSGPADAAEQTLADARLVAGDVSEAFSDEVAAGEVISQDPAADTEVRPGSAVSYVTSRGVETVAVPDLSGPADAAEQTLADARLVAGDVSEAFSDEVAAGEVISQDPAADTEVRPGSAVSYVTSRGVETVAVPDLSGPADAAEQTLADARLVAGDVSEAFSDEVAAGEVISQDPAADTEVRPGSAVSYVTSRGVETVAVPDLSGPADAAEQTLADARLVAGDVSEAFSDEVAAGEVISQDPAADTEVRPGSAVSYVTSRGVETVAVPDLSGPADAAEQTLADARLVAGDVSEAFSDEVAAGEVISQDPAADTEVRPGSAVSYVTSRGVETVAVPDLSGPADAAEQTLADARLVAGDVSEAFSDEVAAGEVISQDPAADTEVRPGSAVSYVTSRGVETVAVPDLSGPADAAEQTLADARLVAGDVSEAFSDEVAAGEVISQDPAADTEVRPGSAVSYVTSRGETPNTIVPAVRDLPAGDAVEAIEAEDLVVADTIEQSHEKVAAGNAIKTDPPADTEVLQGSSVTLFVSTGSAMRTIPEVRDRSSADAEAALAAEGLAVTIDERSNANVAAGDAVKTEPAAGESVAVGSDVVLVVSKGPKPVTVPDVVGLSKAEANQAIKGAGLTVGEATIVEDAAPTNTILSQDPAPDSQVAKGSAVAYTLSSGPADVTIPEVRDRSSADAEAALAAEGLAVTIDERSNANVAAGDAVKTEPAAGESVAVGSDVVLVVSKGPKPVTVPDVVGLSKAEANQAIKGAGLTVGEATIVEDAAPTNTILSQDPAPDSQVAKGSAVAYTLSSGPADVTIPEVRDRSSADAEAALAAEGLAVTIDERSNANVAAGDAVKTEPAAGESVAVGSDVVLVVSKGPKPVTVPDVVGLSKAEANQAIKGAGLTVGEATIVEDAAPTNTILSQDPAPDSQVAKGSAVAYTLSSGPADVTIPEVRDRSSADAEAALAAEGLAVTIDERSNANVAAGDAVKTEPAAGESVAVGSDVVLVVSKGPKPVTVPDVVGLSKAEANQAIKGAGLTVGEATIVEDAAPTNTILSQDPAPDSQVAKGSAVAYTLSSGPADVTIPEVKGQPADEAQAALEALGLEVELAQKTNANVAAGDAVKTAPAAGESVAVGSAVKLTVSKGPKPVTVPDVVGLSEAEATAAITDAGLQTGERSEANDDAIPAGGVVSQDPAEGSVVDKNSLVNLMISLGPVAQPFGEGGSLSNVTVSGQLDAIASNVPAIRGLDLEGTPYDGTSARDQERILAERVAILRDPSTLKAEEKALKRLGLLGSGDDLQGLLEDLYGQRLPIAYLEDDGRQSIIDSIDKLNAEQGAEAAREFGRAATLQEFGSDATRISDKTRGDQALAAYALEQGDGTAVMLAWAADSGASAKANSVIVPGDDGVYASMPLLLQREYSMPFLEGRIFVDQTRKSGGWSSVDGAWGRLPESTEQILHPKVYPNERPTTVAMDDVAGRLGGGWKEKWQQTMGELRVGVWLANGQPGTQNGPKAAVKLPKANAATGWGGDRLVSLDGPDGQWAVVWQTGWDSSEDVDQFVKAANAVIANLPGAHVITTDDVSPGVSDPALVLLTGSDATLVAVADALGVALAPAAE